MGKYLIIASKKRGIFEPYDQRKHYIASRSKLVEMLKADLSWAVWSVRLIRSEAETVAVLEADGIAVEILD